MKRWLVLPFALVAVLALPMGAAANSGSNGNTQHFGPFDSTSVDNGSCSLPWAVDTFQRDFKVSDNGDGTFTVREEYKNGSFVTMDGGSPGACETDQRHGTVVLPGVNGTFTGYLEGTVSGGTYNPGGCEIVGAGNVRFFAKPEAAPEILRAGARYDLAARKAIEGGAR